MSYDLEQRRRRERLEEMRQEEQNDNLLAFGVIAVLAAIAGAAFMLALVAMGMLAYFMAGFTAAPSALPVASPTIEIALPAIDSGATPTAEATSTAGASVITPEPTPGAVYTEQAPAPLPPTAFPPVIEPTPIPTFPPAPPPPAWDAAPGLTPLPLLQTTPFVDAAAATAIAQATAAAAGLQPTPTLTPPLVATLLPVNTEVAPLPQNLIDDRGLPYQLEGPSQLVGSPLRSIDAGGLLQIDGSVTNAGSETYSLVKVNITFFDGQGQVINVASGDVPKTPFGPGDVANFSVVSTASTPNVTTYYVKLETEQ